MSDHEDGRRHRGADRGRPTAPVEQGDLAEEATRAEGIDLPGAIAHGDLAVHDDEELLADTALRGEPLADLHRHLVRELGEPTQLALRHVGEEWDASQMSDLVVSCHCGSLKGQASGRQMSGGDIRGRVCYAAMTTPGHRATATRHNDTPLRLRRDRIAGAAREGVFSFVHLYG